MERKWSKPALILLTAGVILSVSACGAKPSSETSGTNTSAGTVNGSTSLSPQNSSESNSDNSTVSNTANSNETSSTSGNETGNTDITETELNNVSDKSNHNSSSSGSSGEQKEAAKLGIKVFVTDDEILELYPIDAEISYVSGNENSKLKSALEALASVKSEGKTGLWKGVKFNTVSVQDGALTVDITLPDTSRLGAPGEEMALEAIQKTVFQFEEIKSIDILVDGKSVESLMGHLDLDHPIIRTKGE